GFARAEITAFDRVVEEAIDAIAVVLIVLCGIYSALRGDGVGAAWGILKAKAFHLVTQFAQRGGRRSTGEPGAHHDERMPPLIGWIDQLHVKTRFVPLLLNRSGRYSSVEFHLLDQA